MNEMNVDQYFQAKSTPFRNSLARFSNLRISLLSASKAKHSMFMQSIMTSNIESERKIEEHESARLARAVENRTAMLSNELKNSMALRSRVLAINKSENDNLTLARLAHTKRPYLARKQRVKISVEEAPSPDFVQLTKGESSLEFFHLRLQTKETLTKSQLAEKTIFFIEKLVEMRRLSAIDLVKNFLGSYKKYFERILFIDERLLTGNISLLEEAFTKPPQGISPDSFIKVTYHLFAELASLFFKNKFGLINACFETGLGIYQRYIGKKKSLYKAHTHSLSLNKDRSDNHIRQVSKHKIEAFGLDLTTLEHLLIEPSVNTSAINQSYLKYQHLTDKFKPVKK